MNFCEWLQIKDKKSYLALLETLDFEKPLDEAAGGRFGQQQLRWRREIKGERTYRVFIGQQFIRD